MCHPPKTRHFMTCNPCLYLFGRCKDMSNISNLQIFPPIFLFQLLFFLRPYNKMDKVLHFSTIFLAYMKNKSYFCRKNNMTVCQKSVDFTEL